MSASDSVDRLDAGVQVQEAVQHARARAPGGRRRPPTASWPAKTSAEARRSSYSELSSSTGQSPSRTALRRHRVAVGAARRAAEVVLGDAAADLGEEAEQQRDVVQQRRQGRRRRAGRRRAASCRRAAAPRAPSRPSSRSLRAAPAARLPPALAPPSEMRAGSTPRAAALVADPADGGDGVVVRHRVGHAADAEPVVDADHDGAGPRADLAGGPVGLGHVQVAHAERAAVQPDQARAGRRRRRAACRCGPGPGRAARAPRRRGRRPPGERGRR